MTDQGSNLLKLDTGFGKPAYFAILDVDETSMSYFMIGDTCKRTFLIFTLTDTLESEVQTKLLKLASLMGYDADLASITTRNGQEKSCSLLPNIGKRRGEPLREKKEEIAKKIREIIEKFAKTQKAREERGKALAEKARRESQPGFDKTLPSVIPEDLGLPQNADDAKAFTEEFSPSDSSANVNLTKLDTKKPVEQLQAEIPKDQQGRAEDKINCPKFCKSCITSTSCDQCELGFKQHLNEVTKFEECV